MSRRLSKKGTISWLLSLLSISFSIHTKFSMEIGVEIHLHQEFFSFWFFIFKKLVNLDHYYEKVLTDKKKLSKQNLLKIKHVVEHNTKHVIHATQVLQVIKSTNHTTLTFTLPFASLTCNFIILTRKITSLILGFLYMLLKLLD